MKLQCLQENLSKALRSTLHTVPGKPILPVLSHAKIEAKNGIVTITTSDLELSTITEIGGKIEEEGIVLTPAKMLSELVDTLPRELVSMEYSGKTLSIVCGAAKIKLPTTKPEDYPPIPAVNGEPFEIDLAEAVKRTIHSVAKTQDRPVLAGLNIKADGERVSFAAADGFQLAVYSMPSDRKFKVIVPSRTMARLTDAETVTMTIGENVVSFQVDRTKYVSQVIQGTYPNYLLLIPKDFTTKAIVDRLALAQTIGAASKMHYCTRLKIENGLIKVLSIDNDNRYENEIPAEITGDAGKIGFNANYLLSALNSTSEELISLEMSTSSSPMLVKGIGNDSWQYIVMPLFIGEEEINV